MRVPLAGGFAVTAAGMVLLSGVDAGGSYLADVLPGMLVAGVGLGVVLVPVAVAVLTGAEPRRGRDALGPEHHRPRGRRIDRRRRARHDRRRLPGGRGGPAAGAALADGIGNAFLAAGIIAGVSSLIALAVLPSASTFLPKLRLAPRVAVH